MKMVEEEEDEETFQLRDGNDFFKQFSIHLMRFLKNFEIISEAKVTLSNAQYY